MLESTVVTVAWILPRGIFKSWEWLHKWYPSGVPTEQDPPYIRWPEKPLHSARDVLSTFLDTVSPTACQFPKSVLQPCCAGTTTSLKAAVIDQFPRDLDFLEQGAERDTIQCLKRFKMKLKITWDSNSKIVIPCSEMNCIHVIEYISYLHRILRKTTHPTYVDVLAFVEDGRVDRYSSDCHEWLRWHSIWTSQILVPSRLCYSTSVVPKLQL
jgi:hypothetical protein